MQQNLPPDNSSPIPPPECGAHLSTPIHRRLSYTVALPGCRILRAPLVTYVETREHLIYKTHDTLSFRYVGHGTLLGTYAGLLFYFNTSLFIHSGDSHVQLRFYQEQERLRYEDVSGNSTGRRELMIGRDTSSFILLDEPGIQEETGGSREIPLLYASFLVVARGRNVLFITLDGAEDVQYRVGAEIEEAEIVQSAGIELVRIATAGRRAYYFYKGAFVLQVQATAGLPSQLSLHPTERALFDRLSPSDSLALLRNEPGEYDSVGSAAMELLHMARSQAGLIEEWAREEAAQTETGGCRPRNEWFGRAWMRCVEWAEEMARSTWRHEGTDGCPSGTLHGVVRTDRVYKRLFKYNSTLESSESPAYRIISMIKRQIRKRKQAAEEIKIQDEGRADKTSNTQEEGTAGCGERTTRDVKAQMTRDAKAQTPRDVKAQDEGRSNTTPNTQDELASRNTKARDKTVSGFRAAPQVPSRRDFQRTLKVLAAAHGDTRAEEIISLMTECDIAIEADVDDIDSIRQKAFLNRLYSGIGNMLLGVGDLQYYAETVPRLNGNPIDDLVSEDFVFFYSACNYLSIKESSWQEKKNKKISQCGALFGYALVNGLRTKEIFDSLPDDLADGLVTPRNMVCYTLLMLSITSPESVKFSHNRNTLSSPSSTSNPSTYTNTNTSNPSSISSPNTTSSASSIPHNRTTSTGSIPYNRTTHTTHTTHTTSTTNPLPYSKHRSNLNKPTPHETGKSKANETFLQHLRRTDLSIRKASMVAMALYNLDSQNRNIFHSLFRECARYGPVDCDKAVQYFDRRYRALAALCAALVMDRIRPISADDTFSELLINGLSFIQTGLFSPHLVRPDCCRPDEIFYSELFLLLNSTELSCLQATERLRAAWRSASTAAEAARLAATAFYICFKYLTGPSPEDEQAVDGLLSVALDIESDLPTSPLLQHPFDFCLISLSVIRSGSFDLSVLRILRRRILMTKRSRIARERRIFHDPAKSIVVVYNTGVESIQYYKICMGLLCAGLGTSRITLSSRLEYKILVCAFLYADEPILMFRHHDILRMLIVRLAKPSPASHRLAVLQERSARKRVRRGIMKVFKGDSWDRLSQLDQKFLLDVLTDYVESEPEGRPYVDVGVLGRALVNMR